LTNSADASADLRLVTPQVNVPMNTIKLSFSARGSSTGFPLQVGTMNTHNGTFTLLSTINLTAVHVVYNVSFAAYAGTDTYIAFKHGMGGTYRSIYIDNIQFDELLANDFGVTALTGPFSGFANTPASFDITVKNNGTAPHSNYGVLLKNMETRQILASLQIQNQELLPDATVVHTLGWTPVATGNYNIYAEVVLAGDQNAANNTTVPRSYIVYAEGSLVESFESGTIPNNWTVINADNGTQWWAATNVNPRTGTYAARVRWETTSLDNDDWLITPPLQVSSITNDQISFWMRSYGATYADPWQVLISTTNTNPASFTMIDSGDGNMGEYVQKVYNLDSYGDAIIYLAIRYIGSYDWYLYVDDFIGPPIYVPATLPEPVVTISTVGTAVRLDWNTIPSAYQYKVYQADAPDGPWNLITPPTANNWLVVNNPPAKKFYKVVASSDPIRAEVPIASSLEEQKLIDERDIMQRN
ncbi:MAG: choice-of-anchor J domain-containing protein, partial [Candidatus Cloacimonadaceae bacterium]|nr:choice-of-anchor J domain-containing protein [Candidatus Cloacimonadaceae bacterium]